MALLLGPWVGPAPAEPPGVRLQWSAPPQCPDADALLEAIDRALGEVDDDERRAVEVRGELQAQAPEGYRLRLTLDGGRSGTRELRGSSCEELSEAAALVIAMAIDPRLLERMQETPGEEEPEHGVEPGPEPGEVEVPPEPERDPESEPGDGPPEPEPTLATTPGEAKVEVPPERPSSREPVLAFVARFDGGVGGGPLPGPDGVVFVGTGVAGRAWRAELTASYWPPRATSSASHPAVGVRSQLWTVGAQGCYEPRWRTVSLPVCAGLAAGAVHAVGTGEQEPLRVASRWVAVVAEPAVVWWTRPRLGLALRASGHVALARPQWRSEPSGAIFEAGAVGGTLRAGLELRLP
ncbi:MAG: hypothetical protein KC501_10940 [Myxococcales bacterium]|nr:hypothetical protein [Myxococcales bacterium]